MCIPYPYQLLKYNIVLAPHCHKSCISYLLSIVNPTNMQWVVAIFNVSENYPGAHLGDFQCYKGRKCMFRDSRELIQCCIKQSMQVGNLAWPSLNENRARIYGKISRITLWVFDLRLGKASVQIFSLDESHWDICVSYMSGKLLMSSYELGYWVSVPKVSNRRDVIRRVSRPGNSSKWQLWVINRLKLETIRGSLGEQNSYSDLEQGLIVRTELWVVLVCENKVKNGVEARRGPPLCPPLFYFS